MTQIASSNRTPLTVSRPLFIALYIFGLFICIPTSLVVWFIRKRIFREAHVVGATMLVVVIHPEQWNGGSDRYTIGLLRHFVQAGHKVVWLTTMIDHYWAGEDFNGVEILGPSLFTHLPLHPGDWYSQNTALAYFYLCKSGLQPDLVVIDHSASCIPLLKWRFPACRVLFYCHFPQQLVTPSRFFLYRWYSWLMGLVEGRLFEYVDIVMVNSEFTGRQFRKVMPTVPDAKIRVVYPPCDVDSLRCSWTRAVGRAQRPHNERYLFLSMNRFWPEKRLDIILDAAVELKRRGLRPRIQMAGSVMPHIPESKIYFQELQLLCKQLELDDLIEFLPDPTDERKFELYRQCDSVIYTPPNEHFGIVPIEALEQRRPVIVINSGGPAETVLENITGTKIADTCGLLLADAMAAHMERPEWAELDRDDFYVAQRARFEEEFSWMGFGRRIDAAIAELFSGSDENKTKQQPVVAATSCAVQQNGVHQHLKQNGAGRGQVHVHINGHLNGYGSVERDLEKGSQQRHSHEQQQPQRQKVRGAATLPPPEVESHTEMVLSNGHAAVAALRNGGSARTTRTPDASASNGICSKTFAKATNGLLAVRNGARRDHPLQLHRRHSAFMANTTTLVEEKPPKFPCSPPPTVLDRKNA